MLICVGACTFQRSLLYHPSQDTPTPAYYNMPSSVKEITFKSKDATLAAWYSPAQQGNKTIIYFHGNGGHLGYNSPRYIPLIAKGYGLLAIDYQGYGNSTGEPTEENLTADAEASITYLTNNGVKVEDIILYGQSLGSGLAVKMGVKYDVALIALEAPYSSITDVAAGIYPFLPVRILLSDTFNSMAYIGDIKAPLIIFHGEPDAVVPIKFGRKLFAAAHEPKKAIYFPNTKHNYHDMNINLGHMEQFMKELAVNHQ